MSSIRRTQINIVSDEFRLIAQGKAFLRTASARLMSLCLV